jgi:lactoylglutathione lyase
MRTLHVGLWVADLDQSLAFYAALGYEVLGAVPETELGSLTMLKLPGDDFAALELVHDPARANVEPAGISHLVVQVEDLHAAVEHLAGQGYRAEKPGSPDGSDDFWTCWVTDPDGYRIELVQWPAGHPAGMTRADLTAEDEGPGDEAPGDEAPGAEGADRPVMSRATAMDVIAELFRRQQAHDETVLDDLVAADMVNHAAGPQGREGLRAILRTIETDLGPTTLEQHHLVAEGDLVTQHLTLHGTHRASTMPLLAGLPAQGRPAAWTFIHLWRVAGGQIVEHWACRDDMGLAEQLRG